jgi:hypothetical protein
MGSNRRNKGQGQQGSNHQRKPSTSSLSSINPSPSSSIQNTEDLVDETSSSVQFIEALEELEKCAFQISWKEIAWCLAAMLAWVLASAGVGFIARVSISIHYYEAQSAPSSPQFDGRAIGLGPHLHVTILDPFIDYSNSLQSSRNGLDLGRVLTVSKSGQRNMLTVVEMSEPLLFDKEASNDPRLGNSNGTRESDSPRLTPPKIEWSEMARVKPKLCSDGYTYGFDRWSTLKEAVQEVNAISAERYLRWNAFFALADTFTGTFDDDSLYYEEDVVLTICPETTLKARRGPIFINAENLMIECDGCTIDVGGTHLAFGPHAKNILVRGVHFKHASASSLVFFQDGAEATFESCLWTGNHARYAKIGGVADVNSTSILNFYLCHIGSSKSASTSLSSSLSIRHSSN